MNIFCPQMMIDSVESNVSFSPYYQSVEQAKPSFYFFEFFDDELYNIGQNWFIQVEILALLLFPLALCSICTHSVGKLFIDSDDSIIYNQIQGYKNLLSSILPRDRNVRGSSYQCNQNQRYSLPKNRFDTKYSIRDSNFALLELYYLLLNSPPFLIKIQTQKNKIKMQYFKQDSIFSKPILERNPFFQNITFILLTIQIIFNVFAIYKQKVDNFYQNYLLNIINTTYSKHIQESQEMTSSYTRKKIENYSYGLNDVIGKGYSSHVYKGRNDDTNQNVAIKVIDLKMLKNQINKILLQSQIQVLKELKLESHILTLHDVFTTKNNTYIITELCDSDLSKAVKKGLSEQQASSYMQQILNGYLNFANKNIIHRDLKPANILMCDGMLKIADFGFAIKLCDAAKSNKYNVGSPLYMAPQSLRRNQYTLKTDIWALGIIYFQMLTGETPWKAKNQKELLRKIQSEKIDDLLFKLSISNNSKEFLRKSLRVDKNSRLSIENLKDFNFSANQNILMQRKLNIDLQANVTSKYQFHSFTPKTEKYQNKRATERSSQNRNTIKEYSQNKFVSFKNDSINQSIQLKSSLNCKYNPSIISKENPQHNSSTTKNLIPQATTTDCKYDKRLVSKILVSQIHYCRFLYKLLTKIIESSKNGLLQHSRCEVDAITSSYVGIIKHKIQNLMSFGHKNYINAPCYEEYKQTSDCQKLMRITNEYKERYSSELKSYWDNSQCSFTTQSTLNLIEHLHALLQMRNHYEDITKKNQKEIVVLDYLITSKQLIDIFKNGQNFEKFARKSRIEQIVEGKTAEISKDLYEKIMKRAKQIVEYSPHTTLQQKHTMIIA